MAKNTEKKTTEKTATKKERAPFTVRLNKKVSGLAAMLGRMTDMKWASDAQVNVASVIGAQCAKLPADYNPPGSASVSRGFEVGEVVKVHEDYAFMYESMKGKTAKVTHVKKLGEGRGSKTVIKLDNGVSGFAFQFVNV